MFDYLAMKLLFEGRGRPKKPESEKATKKMQKKEKAEMLRTTQQTKQRLKRDSKGNMSAWVYKETEEDGLIKAVAWRQLEDHYVLKIDIKQKSNLEFIFDLKILDLDDDKREVFSKSDSFKAKKKDKPGQIQRKLIAKMDVARTMLEQKVKRGFEEA